MTKTDIDTKAFLAQPQDFASRTFIREDGKQIASNGVPVGEPDPSKGEDVALLTESNRQLKADNDAGMKELTRLRAQVQELSSKSAAPQLDRDKLIAVKGVGPALADEIIAALK